MEEWYVICRSVSGYSAFHIDSVDNELDNGHGYTSIDSVDIVLDNGTTI